MTDVVCAIRGGPGSYQTRLAALQYAADRGVAVHFVSVVDPVAYEPLHEGEQDAIRAEMAWRDLAMTRATAAHAGLDDVRFTVAVRVGALADTIAAYAREVAAGSILIGRPRSAADAALAGGGAEQFAEELRQKGGAALVVIAPAR
ncbi:MAG: universal stress protein [Acidimicrobiia bacterium]|nr:universal stress protein [Acidimicrobiia bacterium]MDH5616285.1 universal stress protein [Acidimicrobiia bacterium]